MKKLLVIFYIILFLSGCESKKYTINFDSQGGTTIDSIEVLKGDTIKNVSPPQKEGYIFVSWEKDGTTFNKNTPIDEDMTLKAIWTEMPNLSREYKVVFDINGKITEEIIEAKQKIEKPKDPTLKYYNFTGWYNEKELYDFDTPVTKDLYLVANFERKILTVSFELDGGSGISEKKIEAGLKLDKPDTPSKLGYKFVGWYYLGKSYNFNSVVEKNIKLVAKWKPINYVTVRYLTNGGTAIKSEVITSGDKAPKPKDPQKDGYKFAYWMYNGIEYDFNLPVEETIELIAIYTEEIPENNSLVEKN